MIVDIVVFDKSFYFNEIQFAKSKIIREACDEWVGVLYELENDNVSTTSQSACVGLQGFKIQVCHPLLMLGCVISESSIIIDRLI